MFNVYILQICLATHDVCTANSTLTNWVTSFGTEASSLFRADHRLHHAARHRLSVRQTEGVSAGGRWEPARFHLSLRHVTSEAAYKHSSLSHRVRTCFQPLKHVNILNCCKLSFYIFIFSAYKQLNVKHEPLQLITPQFETPLPPLQPAVSLFPFSHITLWIHAKLCLLVTLGKERNMSKPLCQYLMAFFTFEFQRLALHYISWEYSFIWSWCQHRFKSACFSFYHKKYPGLQTYCESWIMWCSTSSMSILICI